MAILKITSDNPKFSYIIEKNPNTINTTKTPFKRALRKGNVYGWFSEMDQIFSLYFVDSPVENSFSDHQFEYLDKSRYASPYVPIAIITSALSSALNNPNEFDTEDYGTLVSSTIKVPERILSRFSRMQGFSLVTEEVAPGYYKVSLGASGVMKALNLFQTLCVVSCIVDKDTYLDMPKDVIFKFMKSLVRVNAPYSLRHMVSSYAINNRSVFEEIKPLIDNEYIDIKFGNTQIQRHDAIKSKLKGGEKLLDIGCGEMYHAIRLSEVYDTILAIDEDESICISNAWKLTRKGLSEKITPMREKVDSQWVKDNESLTDGSDVLLGECIEHMPKNIATEFVKELLMSNAKRIVVTVPNKSFNTNFDMSDEEFRHPDHLWEPTNKEWAEFIQEVQKDTETSGRIVSLHKVGDTVRSESVSLMAVFEAKT